MPSQLTSALTMSSFGATRDHAGNSSRVQSLGITRCELLMRSLRQTELEEFRRHLEQLRGLRRVEYIFSEGNISYNEETDSDQEYSQLMRELSIAPTGVEFVFTTVVGSIHYDTAAYLGMITSVLSSSWSPLRVGASLVRECLGAPMTSNNYNFPIVFHRGGVWGWDWARKERTALQKVSIACRGKTSSTTV